MTGDMDGDFEIGVANVISKKLYKEDRVDSTQEYTSITDQADVIAVCSEWL
jgi:hypothetical protein